MLGMPTEKHWALYGPELDKRRVPRCGAAQGVVLMGLGRSG